ncbi:IPT/TIG domain-containing protein, partial [Myxococcota bacterium]
MRRHRIAAVLLLACASGGCRLQEAIEEEYEDRLRQAAPGEIPEEPPVVDQDPIQVNSVLPNRGEISGGLLVEIVGLGFERGFEVFFNDTKADQTEVLTESRIQVVTPAAAVGVTHVYVADPESCQWSALCTTVDPCCLRFGLLEWGFEYYEPVTITSVTPTRGPSLGGNDVIIEGTGFVDGTQVRFGTTDLVEAIIVHAHKAQVTAPRLPKDVYAVTVSNHNGSDTLLAAYSTWDPVRVENVLPFAGPIGGGTPISVYGTGFVDPSNLTLGGQSLATTPNGEETELPAVTLPAVPSSEGAVDVTVDNENGSWTLPNAFVFVDTSNSSARVVSISPATGLIDGGREVHIVGAGFDDPGTVVTFGGIVADCQVISDNAITCTTPPAPEGLVDVRVANGGMDISVPDGFKYIELRIDAATPNNGAIAGNTHVELWGNGFGTDAEVFFDEIPARAVAVANDDRLSLRSPRHESGTVDIRIRTQGVEITESQVYTYFNPYDSDHWSSGGMIEGAVNVTVVDWDSGERLEGAFAMLGVNPSTTHQGFTNDRGQLTLSGPDVVGPQTVTAGKLGYASFSWAEVNAHNLTLLLMPYPPPGTPGGGGPPPPIVRGEITRIKDEWNLGDDLVLVSTTYQDFSRPLPDPGPKSVLVNQGPYELWARTGDMVVLAYAGVVGPNNILMVNAMGFAPFVFTEVGSGQPCATDDDCPAEESCYDY